MASGSYSIDSVLEQEAMGTYRWMLYAACGVLMALEGYDAYVVANLAPIIAESLGIPIPSMGFVFTAQAAGMAVGFYTIPVLADRIGRRGIILVGATIFGLLTLASTTVETLMSFTIIRFLAFAALGGTLPNIVALISEFMPDSRRGQLLTWLFIAHGLGASLAGLLGPSFVALHSWQLAFWVGGGLLLVFVPFLYTFLPESCRYLIGRDPADQRVGHTLRRIQPNFAWVEGSSFFTAELSVSGSPIAGLFRDGRAMMTILLWMGMGAALCVTATLSSWLPSYLHLLGGLESATATRMSSVSAFGAMLGPLMLTFMMKRFGMPLSLGLTLCVAYGAMVSLTFVEQLPWLGWVLGFAFGLFVIGAQAGLNSLVASSYPTSIRSTGIGYAGGIGRLTSMIGPGVGAAILAAGWSATAIYATISAPLLLAAVAMLIFHFAKRQGVGARSIGAHT